jgi:hypothetical protein
MAETVIWFHPLSRVDGQRGYYDRGCGKYRGAGLHHHQRRICRYHAPGDQRGLVGAAGDLRRAVVGRKGTLGQAVGSNSDLGRRPKPTPNTIEEADGD